MNSCNRVIPVVIISLTILSSGCDAAQNTTGLDRAGSAVAVPPKGVGIAPIDGHPGNPAASYPVASIGANNAPGSIAPYGGQWIVPLPVAPGAKILNTSCDYITTAGVVTTMELVGRAGIITSKVIGPASGVFTTVWLLPTDADPNGYTVGDGEVPALRLSFRDTSGAWTTSAKQQPVLSCAVNASAGAGIAAAQTVNIPVETSPSLIGSAASGYSTNTSWGLNASGGDGAMFIAHAIPVGSTVTAIRAKVDDASGVPITIALLSKEMPALGLPTWAARGNTASSSGSGAVQQVSLATNYLVPSFTEVAVAVNSTGSGGFHVYALEADIQ
jgi:hypothetical protein